MRINGRICRLHAIIDGTKYDVGPIKASEAEKLLAWTGYQHIKQWEVHVTDGDALACRALLMLMEFRKGNHVRMDAVEIDDIDSIEAELRDENGRVASVVVDGNEPRVVRGDLVWEFDGEPVDPPSGEEPSPTG